MKEICLYTTCLLDERKIRVDLKASGNGGEVTLKRVCPPNGEVEITVVPLGNNLFKILFDCKTCGRKAETSG